MQRNARGAYRQLCVSEEFARLQAGVSAPITDWLCALARDLSEGSGGRPVGAIGMCLTGAFAIPLILEPRVAAHVAAQPGCPFSLAFRVTGIGRGPWMSQLNISDEQLERAANRARAEQLTLLTLRFESDRICPRQRVARAAGVVRRSPGRARTGRRRTVAHAHLPAARDVDRGVRQGPDRSDHPTRVAFTRVVEFMRARLK